MSNSTEFKNIKVHDTIELSNGLKITDTLVGGDQVISITDGNDNRYVSFNSRTMKITIGSDVEFFNDLFIENSTPEELSNLHKVLISKFGDIINDEYWALRADGSGSIAGGGLSWSPNGEVVLKDKFRSAIHNTMVGHMLWDDRTKYTTSQTVSDGEQVWLCSKDNINVRPAKGEYWSLYIAKGATGETGPIGKTGRDGKDGKDGRDGQDGSDGRDGQDGHSRYHLDLTNDNDSIAAEEDNTNILTDPIYISTTCKMFFGATEIKNADIQISINDYCDCHLDENNKLVITAWKDKLKDPAITKFTIEFVGRYGGVEQDRIEFTLTKLAKGENARISNIIMSHDVLIKKKDGSTYPSILECSEWVRIGNNPPQALKSHYMFSKKDNSNDFVRMNPTSDTFTVATSDVREKLSIYLFEEDVATSNILDVEHIGVISDGIDATSPYKVNLTNDTDSIPGPYVGPPEDSAIKNIKTKPQLYYGNSRFPFEVDWRIVCDGCTMTKMADNETYQLQSITTERATVLFSAFLEGTEVGSCIFTVSIVRGGEKGDPAVIYKLDPECEVVHYNYDVYSPSHVSCQVKKYVGNELPVVSTEHPIFYSKNSGAFALYTGPVEVVDGDEDIVFDLRDTNINGKSLDKEVIPVVKDGKNAYFINLTNDNDSVAADKTGFPNATQLSVIRTKPQMFYGSTLIDDATVTFDTTCVGCTVAKDNATGEYYLTSINADKATVKFSAKHNGVPVCNILFTVTIVRNGADTIIYRLQPNCDVIAHDLTLFTPSIVTCRKMKYVGQNTVQETDEHTLKYRVNGGALQNYTSSGITVVAGTKLITFELTDSSGNMLDKEEIPVVKDGAKGDSVYFINLTNDNDSVASNQVDFPRPEALNRIRTKPMLFYGITQVVNDLTWDIQPANCTYDYDSATGEYYLKTITADKASLKFTAKIKSVVVSEIFFTVSIVRGGEDITIYRLSPNCDVIAYGGNKFNPSIVTCRKMKFVGNDYGKETQDHILKYKVNSGTFLDYPTSGITVESGTTSITFQYQTSDGTVLDTEHIPVVKDGIDGTDGKPGNDGKSAYSLNLTNDNDSVACNKDGSYPDVSVLNTIKTKPQLYLGVTEVTTGLSWSTSTSGCTVTKNTSTGEYYLTGLSADKATVTFTATHNSVNVGSVIFSITAVKSGADGSDAVLYKLITDCDVIACSEDGNTFTPASVGCKKMKCVGNTTPTITTDHVLKYQINGGTLTNYTDPITLTKGTTSITFIYQTSSGVELDKEIIPVVKNGATGPTGPPGGGGEPGTDGRVYYLLPSSTSIIVPKGGVKFPSTISCAKKISVGDTAPTDSTYGALYYSIDGAAEIAYTGALQTTTMTKHLTFNWYTATNKTNKVDTVVIPVVYDGTDGIGTPGDAGRPGTMPRLRGEWNDKTQYVYGDEYRDVILHRTSVTADYKKYTVKSYGSNPPIGTPPTNTTYWSAADEFDFISTGLILSKQAFIDNLITRSLSTSEDPQVPRLQIIGSLMTVYGNSGKKNIEFGVDTKTGMAVMKYFDNNGNMLYNLGPNGIDWGNFQGPSWSTIVLVKCPVQIDSLDYSMAWDNGLSGFFANQYPGEKGVTYYKYNAGNLPGTTEADKAKEKYIYKTQDTSGAKLEDGWYLIKFQGSYSQWAVDDRDPVNKPTYIKPDGDDAIYQELSGVRNEAPIYFAGMEKYTGGGVWTKSVRVFWQGNLNGIM